MSVVTDIVGDTQTSGPDHEERDYERAVKTWSAGKFDEWPNEAGVRHSSICPSRG